MAELRDEKLDFWIRNRLNVLFIGHAGIGKTSRVVQAFQRNGLKYKYFSASTMDPWCDFVGVPKAVSNGDGQSHLEYVLPKDFQDDSVEAIFMDEFNRSHRKVRNAVMELIQFKSINGRPFKNLKMIWAAVNPEGEDEGYQVEPLDWAQKDRFQIHFNLPYKPNKEWFHKEFGDRIAKAALDWWEDLPAEQKKEISPRRLEYALRIYKLPGGDIKDVLPHGCNTAKLLTTINSGPPSERLLEFFTAKDSEGAKKFLAVANNYDACIKLLALPQQLPSQMVEVGTERHQLYPDGHRLLAQDEWMGFFLPLLSPEKISSLMADNNVICDYVLNHSEITLFRRVMQDILEANQNKKIARLIKKVLGGDKTVVSRFGALKNTNPTTPYYNSNARLLPTQSWSAQLAGYIQQPMEKTPQRLKIYSDLANSIPEKLTAQEAVDTLELLTMTVGRCWADMLKNTPHVMGVFNHCIDQLHKATGLGLSEMLKLHGQKFEKLLDKFREARIDDKILCPEQRQDMSDLLESRMEKFLEAQESMEEKVCPRLLWPPEIQRGV